MSVSIKQPIYDPAKTYDDNFDNGPFGEFSNPETYKNENEPKFTFLGYPIYSPFGIPAGPLLHFGAARIRGWGGIADSTGCRDDAGSARDVPSEWCCAARALDRSTQPATSRVETAGR